jgi:hypothetical protein
MATLGSASLDNRQSPMGHSRTGLTTFCKTDLNRWRGVRSYPRTDCVGPRTLTASVSAPELV